MTAYATATKPPSAALAEALDAADPLRSMRDRFIVPDGLIYLCGNSLGCLPKGVDERVSDTVRREWGEDLIRSWNKAGWVDCSRRVGDKLAALIGAAPGSVVAGDSTSINIFKVLAAALDSNPERRTIVSERQNFPTDLYMAEGLAALLDKGHRLALADTADEIETLINDDTAVLMLTHASYQTSLVHDMERLTRLAHDNGALVIWDLAHSAGAMPLDLAGTDADFAVGCGYKYLNGGPGAPAFVYVAPRLQADAKQPLTGWFSHAAPFAFESSYRAGTGLARFLVGTPAVLSMNALEAALDVWADVDMQRLRDKCVAMTGFFIAAVEHLCSDHQLTLITPRDSALRGSQVSFTIPDNGYPVIKALIARGVVGDFRAPNIMRFGFAPLYNSFSETWRAAETMAMVLDSREWDQPQFSEVSTVT